jgi:hypothetical protein
LQSIPFCSLCNEFSWRRRNLERRTRRSGEEEQEQEEEGSLGNHQGGVGVEYLGIHSRASLKVLRHPWVHMECKMRHQMWDYTIDLLLLLLLLLLSPPLS